MEDLQDVFVPHTYKEQVVDPPAGATTLIVSLGILRQPWQLGVLMLAVVVAGDPRLCDQSPRRYRLSGVGTTPRSADVILSAAKDLQHFRSLAADGDPSLRSG